MKNGFFALLTVLGLCLACQSQGLGGRYWIDHAKQSELFHGQDVVAVASVDRWLYVSTGASLFQVNRDGISADVTARVKKSAADQITDVLVDSARKELWIVLNSNTLFASCYSDDLEPRDCPRAFLDQRTVLMEALQKDGPQSSVSALAFDGDQAIEGYFKGGIYLYSMLDRRLRLVYKPSSPGNWAVSAVLTNDTAFVATRGDGLIAVDRKTAAAVRFPDKDDNYIHSLAVRGPELYIAAKGLYRANIAAYRTAPKPHL